MAAACGGRLSVDDLRTGPTPIINGREVTFVAAGTDADPPRLVADFNGWDAKAGAMKRAADGVYTLHVRLDPAARIEYLIAYNDRFDVDPRNPLQVPSPTGAPRSELRMPGYRPPPALPTSEPPGVVQNVPFTSRAGETRRVRVHRPANLTTPAPILYVHDGIIAVEQLDMPAIIDGLVASNQMAPITTVYINSVDRYDDFAVGSMFSYVFMGEVVPMIEQRYPLHGDRALLGFSRSTVGALDAALNGNVSFARVGLVAPAMNAPTLHALLKAPRATAHVTILAGTYDLPLIEDAQALRAALERHKVPQDWFEIPEGHNHTAWRAQLRRLLPSWFPTRPSSYSARRAAIGSTLVARRAGI
jgi:enterochelin esterase-like enzyme